MNAENRIIRFRSSPMSFIAVAASAVIAFAISVYCLNLGIFTVFQNLFYFPIILSCIYYLKRGFIFSVILASLYFFLIISRTTDLFILIEALIRVTIFIVVGGVVTFLSIQRKSAEKSLVDANAQLGSEVEERKKAEQEKVTIISELQKTLAELKILRGILPICSFCKKIRNDKGYWDQVEIYVGQHSNAEFSHSICPECVDKHYSKSSGEKAKKPNFPE